METDSEKCMQESREDVLWCGDAGQNVLAVRQMEIHLSLCMSVRVLCPHRGHVYSLALQVYSTLHSVHIPMALPPCPVR